MSILLHAALRIFRKPIGDALDQGLEKAREELHAFVDGQANAEGNLSPVEQHLAPEELATARKVVDLALARVRTLARAYLGLK